LPRYEEASLLRDVEPSDAPTLVIAPVFLGVMGSLAAILAASRVPRADPAATLHAK
jgi:hypothetical protein